MANTGAPVLPWNPHLFGPLEPEEVGDSTAFENFRGEERHFGRRQIQKRALLRVELDPVLRRGLQSGEQILSIAPGLEIGPLFERLGMGILWSMYYRVALVLTDQRLVEVLLDRGGRVPETRVRSVPWSQVERLSVGIGGLHIRAGKFRRTWRLSVRGDKKLLRLLVAKISEARVGIGGVPMRSVPLWHCPQCGRAFDRHPKVCDGCGTLFRTRSLAAGLALAFPGGGLFYAGHRFIAVLDLLGEFVFYGIVVAAILTAPDQPTLLAAVLMGVLFLVLTKLESVHLATTLVHRTKPYGEEKHRQWRRAALILGVASLAAILLPFLLRGRLANARIDRDLDLTHSGSGWRGGFDRSKWVTGAEDREKRSEWVRSGEEIVEVFAYPLSPLESFRGFVGDYREGTRDRSVAPAEVLPLGSLETARAIERAASEDGTQFRRIIYLVHEPGGHDLHMVVLAVLPESESEADTELKKELRNSRWVDAAARSAPTQ